MLHNKKYALAGLVLVAIVLLVAVWFLRTRQALPTSAQREAADKALAWLRTQQLEDGSFDAGFGHPAGVTCDVALAVAASGSDPATWRSTADRPSLTEYLSAHAQEYATDAATTGKLIVTLVAAGVDPKEATGTDLVAHLQSFVTDPGTYDAAGLGQAWAILALRAAGEKVPAAALSVLKSYQLASGAWASAFGPDNDTTAYALQALVAAGEPKGSTAMQRALAFLQGQQNDDGGFPVIKPSEWGTDTNANSTANVIMGLLAVGEKPTSEKWSKAGRNPLTALFALQAADGRIEFQPGVGSPLMATAQAIPALLGRTLPLRGRK